MSAAIALDHAAVFVFALTGALRASRAQLDIVGFLFLANLTAVGGGTVRDLLLGRDPVFWIAAPEYLATGSAGALIVFLTAHRLESRLQVLTWLDAVALSVAVSAGIAAARSVGAAPEILVIMGIVTGVFGGLMRDVVVGEVPLILRAGELYATAAFAGAAVAVIGLQALGGGLVPVLLGAATVFALRAGSLALGWRLPVYRHGPPRT